MPAPLEICFKFRVHEGTVLNCWKTGCKKRIGVGEFAFALKRDRSGLQRGLIWCEGCAKELEKVKA